MDHDAEGEVGKPDDEGEILERVVACLLVVGVAQRIDRHGGKQMAIGCSGLNQLRRQGGARTRLGFDDDRLAQGFLCTLGEGSKVLVHHAGGWQSAVDRDRSARKSTLRMREG